MHLKLSSVTPLQCASHWFWHRWCHGMLWIFQERGKETTSMQRNWLFASMRPLNKNKVLSFSIVTSAFVDSRLLYTPLSTIGYEYASNLFSKDIYNVKNSKHFIKSEGLIWTVSTLNIIPYTNCVMIENQPKFVQPAQWLSG